MAVLTAKLLSESLCYYTGPLQQNEITRFLEFSQPRSVNENTRSYAKDSFSLIALFVLLLSLSSDFL